MRQGVFKFYNPYNPPLKKELILLTNEFGMEVSSDSEKNAVVDKSPAATSPLKTPESASPKQMQHFILPGISDTSGFVGPEQDKGIGFKEGLEQPFNQQVCLDNIPAALAEPRENYFASDPHPNLSEKKRSAKLPLSRMYAAYKRKRRALKARGTDLARRQLGQLYSLMDRRLSKCEVTAFKPRHHPAPLKPSPHKSGLTAKLIISHMEEDAAEAKDGLEVEMVSAEMFESKLVLNEDSPRTPPPDTAARKVLRQRVEATPLTKDIEELPDHVYNSDDDKLMEDLEREQFRS